MNCVQAAEAIQHIDEAAGANLLIVEDNPVQRKLCVVLQCTLTQLYTYILAQMRASCGVYCGWCDSYCAVLWLSVCTDGCVCHDCHPDISIARGRRRSAWRLSHQVSYLCCSRHVCLCLTVQICMVLEYVRWCSEYVAGLFAPVGVCVLDGCMHWLAPTVETTGAAALALIDGGRHYGLVILDLLMDEVGWLVGWLANEPDRCRSSAGGSICR